jgi:hypothetical protein
MINFFVIFAFTASVLEFELLGAEAYDYGFRGWEVHGSVVPSPCAESPAPITDS